MSQPNAGGEPTPNKSGRRLVLALAVVLAAVFLYLALRNIDWAKFLTTVQRGNYTLLLVVFVWSSATYFVRSLRWRVLLNAENNLSPVTVFWATMAGYFGNNFLPARAGELIRSLMLGQASNISSTFVLATALTERLVDVVALVIIASVSLLSMGGMPDTVYAAVRVMAAAGLAGLTVLMAAPRFQSRLRWLIERLPLLPTALKERLSGLLERFLTGMRSLHSWRRTAGFAAFTALIWLLDGIGTTIGVKIFNLTLSLPQALLFLSGLGLSSAIPSTPGYVGVYQFVAVTVLGPFGIAQEDALAYILVAQVSNFVVVGLWGALGMWRLRGYGKK